MERIAAENNVELLLFQFLVGGGAYTTLVLDCRLLYVRLQRVRLAAWAVKWSGCSNVAVECVSGHWSGVEWSGMCLWSLAVAFVGLDVHHRRVQQCSHVHNAISK